MNNENIESSLIPCHLLRPKELAEYLRVSIDTVWTLAKEGKITAYKITPKVSVFRIDEVQKNLFGEVFNKTAI